MRYDPDISAAIAATADEPAGRELPLEEYRAAFVAAMLETGGPPQPVEGVQELTAAGAAAVPVTVYRPAGLPSPAPALVLLHGGGWVIGDRASHDPLARALANMATLAVVSVDYRLAPEHPFPAALADCLAATRWVVRQAAELGLDPARIAVGGDSAGGNLATVVARYARDEGWPLAHQLLIYPVTDAACDTESYRRFADDGVLDAATMRWFWDRYLGEDGDVADADASPLNASDLSGLPPATVVTAEYDILRDEGEAYADRLADAGVPVTSLRARGMPHGFLNWLTTSAGVRALAPSIAALLKEGLAGPHR